MAAKTTHQEQNPHRALGRNGKRRKARLSDSTDETSQRQQIDRTRAQEVPALGSGAILRAQLWATFVHMHYPSQEAQARLVRNQTWIVEVAQGDCANVLLGPTVDAVCLAYFGTQINDPSLVHSSQIAYGHALGALARCVAGARVGQIPEETMVASIVLLSMLNESIPLQRRDQWAWAAHYWGVQRYLEACGPSYFGISTPLGRRAFLTLCLPCLFLGLAQRKAVLLDRLVWLKPREHGDVGTAWKGKAGVMLHMMRLPAILSRVDAFLAGKTRDGEVPRICAEIHTLGARLEHCFENDPRFSWLQSSLCDLRERDELDVENPIRWFVANSSMFPQQFSFGELDHCNVDLCQCSTFTLYTMGRLMLDCTFLRLIYGLSRSGEGTPTSPTQHLLSAAKGRAVDLCRSVFHRSGTRSVAWTTAVDLFVELCQNFFSEISADEEFKWCKALRCTIKLRLNSLKASEPPTLCRVGDVASSVARIGFFRTESLQG